MMSHGFRKFFRTQLTLAKVDPDVRRPFTGHKGLDEVYNRLSEDEVFAEYTKAISFLTINPNQQLLKQVEELKEKKNEVTIMELKHRQTMDLILEDNRNTKEQLEALRIQIKKYRDEEQLENDLLLKVREKIDTLWKDYEK